MGRQRRRQPDEGTETTPAGLAASPGSSGGSSGSPNLFGLESGTFEPPDDADAAARAGEALEGDDDYEPLKPELVDWSPERAAFIVKAGGRLLHVADPLADEPGGDDLWKATQSDVDEIAPPLARILNRYEPARRLAGLSDEGELALGMIAYAKRNLSQRGRLREQRKARLQEAEQPGGFFDGAGGGEPGLA